MPSPTTVLLRTQSDERLVALARAGHERAFEAIVERYRRPLVRACRRVLPEARAEDAVQQTLVAAWTGLCRGDEVRELRPWLYRIARNTALNQLRLSGYDHDELTALLDIGPAPDEELERRHVARQTLSGLASLPERQRDALLQIAVQGRGQDEVARAMGISEPAVRQLVHRARTHLRAAVTAITPMPLAGWLADASTRSAPVTERVGELVGGAGSAGAAATAAKLGAVVVLAGGAAAGPTVVDRLQHGEHVRGRAPALGAAEARAAEPAASPTPAATAAAMHTVPASRVRAAPPAPASAGSSPVSRPARRGSGGSGGSGGTGGSRRDDEPAREDEHSETSGSSRSSGSSGSSGSGSGRSRDATEDGGEHSSGGDDVAAPEPPHEDDPAASAPISTPTPEPDDDHLSGDSSGSGETDDVLDGHSSGN